MLLGLDRGSFHMIAVDEAGHATEPEVSCASVIVGAGLEWDRYAVAKRNAGLPLRPLPPLMLFPR